MNQFINQILQGDVLEQMALFPDESINCIITSPPYWQLRDYGYAKQWGLEPTFQEYLEHLWQFIDECKRVLTPNGTIWVNLGDSYNGNKIGNTSNKGYCENTTIDSFAKAKAIKNKSLLLLPHRFAIGCIDRGLIVRNDIIWAKRNGMPESVRDRFSKKHEYMFFMVKNEKYYFDLDSIREKQKDVSIKRYQYEFTGQEGGEINNFKGVRLRDKSKENYQNGLLSPIGKGARPEWNVNGKNPGSVSDFWDIPTKPSSKKHYASYNSALIDKPIITGCPKNGVILDPFCGTGTTLARAKQLGRKIIGIEYKQEYCDIARTAIALNEQLIFT